MVTGNIVVDTTEIFTQIIEAVGSVASGIQSLRILRISQDYYKLYKGQRDFYYGVFHNGVEAPLANEVYSIPFYNKDYAGRVGEMYNAITGPFGGASTDTLGWWTRRANMYGDAPDPRIKELEADTMRLRSDWSNHQFRFEEHWADLRNDTRWQKRMMLHNIGTKQGTAASSALGGALSFYQENIQDMGSMLATYGNGVASYAGYKRGLSDTADDMTTGTYYGGGSSVSDMRSVGAGIATGVSYYGSTNVQGIGEGVAKTIAKRGIR